LLALISSFLTQQSYLIIYWIDFYQMEGICVNFLDPSQFFDSSKDVGMATNFVSYRALSLGAEVSQDPLDRFSQSLHHMVGIELQMINPTFFSQYLKGCCHGNHFCGKITYPPCTYRFGILKQNGISLPQCVH